jgi:hypothetical protein
VLSVWGVGHGGGVVTERALRRWNGRCMGLLAAVVKRGLLAAVVFR